MIAPFEFIDANLSGEKERKITSTTELYNKLSAEETNLIRVKINQIAAEVNTLAVPLFPNFKLKYKADGNLAQGTLEVGDIVGGYYEENIIWDLAVYDGGDVNDKANYTKINDSSVYKGTLNLTTPVLMNGAGTIGEYFKVIEAGSYDFGAGAIVLAVNDFVIYNGFTYDLYINNNQSGGGGGGDITIIHKNLTDGGGVTNTTNFLERFAYGFLVEGGTVSVDNFVRLEASFKKLSGGNAELYPAFYINTVNSLSGATKLSDYSSSNTAVYVRIERTLAIKTATQTELLHQGTSSLTGFNQASTDGDKNIDWTTDKYIILSIKNNGALDATWCKSTMLMLKF